MIHSNTVKMLLLLSILYDRRGVTALEYGLIAALIAAVIIGSVALLGNNLNNAYNGITAGF